MANLATLGIAKQGEFGTAITDNWTPVKIMENVSLSLDIDRIENNEMFGGVDPYVSEMGTRAAAVSVEGWAYPLIIGHFLQLIGGAPTTTGTAPNFEHTYTPGNNINPIYTFGFDETNGLDSYFQDVAADNLTLTQEVGQPLTYSLSAIATDQVFGALTIETTGVETRPFRFTDFTASVKVGTEDASDYKGFKNVSLSISSPIENIFTLDGNRTAYVQEFTGQREITLDGTLYFSNSEATELKNAFVANTNVAVVLKWAITDGAELEITIPSLRVLAHDWTRGRNETELTISGQAFYNAGDARAIRAVLKNTQATY